MKLVYHREKILSLESELWGNISLSRFLMGLDLGGHKMFLSPYLLLVSIPNISVPFFSSFFFLLFLSFFFVFFLFLLCESEWAKILEREFSNKANKFSFQYRAAPNILLLLPKQCGVSCCRHMETQFANVLWLKYCVKDPKDTRLYFPFLLRDLSSVRIPILTSIPIYGSYFKE